MREVTGNMFELVKTGLYDGMCITTNGVVKQDGACVMGRGCALEIRKYVEGIEFDLGDMITNYGNYVFELGNMPLKHTADHIVEIFSFPTKHNWKDKSDIKLIILSAKMLMNTIEVKGLKSVLLPRPGCGNGGLNWSAVKYAIAPILDHRINIVSY